MDKVFGLLSTSCRSVLASSQPFPAEPVQKKEEDSNMKREREQLKEHFSAWDRPHGLVGLHNIGQTCCLNSLIQLFIMNVDFAKILKRITVPRGVEEQKRSVPFQLLLLLEKMQDSRQKAVQPLELAYCLQKYRVPLFVQHDAAQLYLIVWNLIKDQITDVDLEDALQCFFQPKELSAESKCFCQNCGKKSHGKQVLKLNRLPQTLTIHLLRFCIRNSKTEKICHSLCFPQSLDFNQVLPTEQDLCNAEDQPEGRYELFAVIAHVGVADFGHYCAYIRNSVDGKWFCFNDSSVCSVSWEDIRCTYGNHNYRWNETAYLLVYTKLEY
ncbi:ubl carboxyl-terminal hydrolase 18 isoform X2 [Trichechus manatus latirostris]|uniref:Ubl carboxyl-terminal hydrolase 18 isoform X2 n=1 Tax=Trichechus manatus latirostris TaxID=127582 RepID=A0A2Y9R7R6_TRIMA|nr:ubl carboxyl-terminal hydrolase 18 isoform X2 [Trichechus manatus latirostris]